MRYVALLVVFLSFIKGFGEESYEFIGTHFIASYYECCSESLNDKEYLTSVIEEAVEASGASLLDKVGFQFTPQGVTILALLAESHASIHTYPEKQACFVDLFTCGNSCDYENFHDVMQKALKAKHVSKTVLERQ